MQTNNLTDTSVRLELFGPQHLESLVLAVHELTQSPTARRLWWAKPDYSAADAKQFLDYVLMLRKEQAGETFVITNAQNTFFGLANAKNTDTIHGCFQGGYWLIPSARGKGIATNALRQLIDWAASLGMNRAEFIIGVDNRASQAVAMRCGAVSEGVMRSRLRVDGKKIDAMLLAYVQ
jgi:ribosomal-protein-serine acetyltransferase